MLQRFTSRRSMILGITLICVAAFPVGAEQLTPPELSDVMGIDGATAKRGAPVITDILMVDPALSDTYPNLAGGISDVNGDGVDPSDPRFVDSVEIISIGQNPPRPAYFPSCPTCFALKAVEFGNTGVLPQDSAGLIYLNDVLDPTEWIFQVATINPSLVDDNGRLTGFDYREQHQDFESRAVIGDVEGQILFLDQNGDGVHDVWRVNHAGDMAGGGYGPPPFVLDVDIVTVDLNEDGKMDVVTFNDFFNVWDQLGGNSGDLEGAQPYLSLSDDPTEPSMRSVVFDNDAMDSATVAGGALPVVAPLAGVRQQIAAIPALSRWGMGVLLTCMALAGWVVLRRCGIAGA